MAAVDRAGLLLYCCEHLQGKEKEKKKEMIIPAIVSSHCLEERKYKKLADGKRLVSSH